MKLTQAQILLAQHVDELDVCGGGWVVKTEYRFAPPRKWRFDVCLPALRVAFECNGGKWSESI